MNRSKVSTGKSDWCTPDDLYQELDRAYHFDLDAACTKKNCKAKNGLWYPEQDALKLKWYKFGKIAFLNPPYSKGVIGKFVARAHKYASQMTTVCLLPASPEVQWWREYVLSATNIYLLGRRVSFVDNGVPQHGNGWPSAIVVFSPQPGLEKWRGYKMGVMK